MLVKRDIHMPKNEIEPLSYSITTINTRWIKDLTVRTEMVKLLKENRGKSFLTLVLAMIFFFGCDTEITSNSSENRQEELHQGLPWWLSIKESSCNSGGSALKNPAAIQEPQETQIHLWVRKIPWRKAQQLTPVFLPGKSHGQRSLGVYSP